MGMLAAFVASDEDEVLGHVALMTPSAGETATLRALLGHNPPDDAVMLCRLFVHPRHRNSGIAERLVETARSVTKSQFLEVLEKDVAAIRLYERLGWTLVGTSSHGYGDDETMLSYWYKAPARMSEWP
ncbi:MAG: GNAT family N-acetyltransferase [Actinomycetales bacterium]|nr:GNAT family N-acetyltransferase [Actinomycetales bacterium]